MRCSSIAKFILIVTNGLLLLAGLLPLCLGIAILIQPKVIDQILSYIPGGSDIPDIINLPELLKGAVIYMIIAGVILVVIGFLGCVGAIKESPCLLVLYFLLMTIILLTAIAFIVIAVFFQDLLENTATSLMKKSLTDKFRDGVWLQEGNFTLPTDVVNAAWIGMQFEVGCCGAKNYTDYSEFTWNNNYTIGATSIKAVVPPSCCKLNNDMKDIPKSINDFQNMQQCIEGVPIYINQQNCYDGLVDLITGVLKIFIGIYAGICGLLLIEIIASIYLWRKIRNKRNKYM